MVTDSISLLARAGAFLLGCKREKLHSEHCQMKMAPTLIFPLGAAYHFNKQLAVDWQISRYYMEDKADNNLDIDTVSLGLTYNF